MRSLYKQLFSCGIIKAYKYVPGLDSKMSMLSLILGPCIVTQTDITDTTWNIRISAMEAHPINSHWLITFFYDQSLEVSRSNGFTVSPENGTMTRRPSLSGNISIFSGKLAFDHLMASFKITVSEKMAKAIAISFNKIKENK